MIHKTRAFWLSVTGGILLFVAGVVVAQNTANYMEQGGARWVIGSGGSIDVASGGEIDIESGGAIEIAGTAITSTAAELNILDGVTATATELNLIDGYTGTTAELNSAADLSSRVVSTASGPLTMNAINLATAGATDHDVPDATCAAAGDIGTWFTVVVEDASTVIEIQPLDVSNTLIVEGLAQSAGDELDSCVSGTENEGCSITFTCLAADQWYSTARVGTWQVGGAAD